LTQRILFEDDALIIYNKPIGIISDGEEFLSSAKKHLSDIQLVHRLDRDTSGALIFSKGRVIFQKMKILFKEEKVKKRYLCVVQGDFQKKRGTIDKKIGVSFYEGNTKRFGVKEGGRRAKTYWEVIETKNKKTYLYLYPITGRTHQLRVHMSYLGHPILGDTIYGREAPAERMFLHAEQLCFPHPKTNESLKVSSPVPDVFNLCTQSVSTTHLDH